MGRSLRTCIKIAEEFETVDHEFAAIFFEGGGAADCEGHPNRGEMGSSVLDGPSAIAREAYRHLEISALARVLSLLLALASPGLSPSLTLALA